MNIFKTANNYLKECDWKDMALLKFCLIGLGMTTGGILAKKHCKETICFGTGMFVATYIPVMAKFGKFLLEDIKKEDEA